MEYLKPTKCKLLISLIPFFLLFFLIPFLIPERYLDFMDTDMGFFLMLPSFFVYWLFLTMAVPLANTFGTFGLMNSGHGGGILTLSIPEITIPGLLVVSFIYSVLIYFILSASSAFKKK